MSPSICRRPLCFVIILLREEIISEDKEFEMSREMNWGLRVVYVDVDAEDRSCVKININSGGGQDSCDSVIRPINSQWRRMRFAANEAPFSYSHWKVSISPPALSSQTSSPSCFRSLSFEGVLFQLPCTIPPEHTHTHSGLNFLDALQLHFLFAYM